jgi:hypothetical protein
MTGNVLKVFVRRKHCEVVAYAQLGQQRVNGSDLHAIAAAVVPQSRSANVIVAIRHQQRHGGKAIENLIARLWAGEALEQFLKHEACSKQHLTGFDGADQCSDFVLRAGLVTSKRKGPNARIDEQAHFRARSAL